MHVSSELAPPGRWTRVARDIGPGTIGPAAVGVALALNATLSTALMHAVAFPTVIVGVAMLMVPALYIGVTILDRSPTAHAITTGLSAALRDTGLILLGFALPVAFVVRCAGPGSTMLAVGLGVVAFALAVGLLTLHGALFRGRGRRMQALFAGWSLIGVAIGARLLALVLTLEAS